MSGVTTPEGILVGLNQKFAREARTIPVTVYSAQDLSILFSEKVREMNLQIQKDRDLRKKFRTADAEGWKGKDELTFEDLGENWIITEHRRDKNSGEIATIVHRIPEDNVNVLWTLIRKICPTVGTSTTYRKLIPSIIEAHHFPIELEEANGGRNRSSFYFPKYYYPVKILEYLEKIRYGGRGKIVRLQE